ncbi:uncharacterized protein zf(u1like)-5 isoform X1 [Ciona intestinalis]
MEEYYNDESEPYAGLMDFGSTFYCKVCDISCSGQSTLDTHYAGKKHNKILRKKGLAVMDLSSNNFKTITTNVLEDREESTAQQNFHSLAKEEPVIGLEYVVEYRRRDGNGAITFFCELCNVASDSNIVYDHVCSTKHRVKYMKQHHFDRYKAVTGYPDYTKQSNSTLSDKAFFHAKIIMGLYGGPEVIASVQVRENENGKIGQQPCDIVVPFKKPIPINGIDDINLSQKEQQLREKEEELKRREELLQQRKQVDPLALLNQSIYDKIVKKIPGVVPKPGTNEFLPPVSHDVVHEPSHEQFHEKPPNVREKPWFEHDDRSGPPVNNFHGPPMNNFHRPPMNNFHGPPMNNFHEMHHVHDQRPRFMNRPRHDFPRNGPNMGRFPFYAPPPRRNFFPPGPRPPRGFFPHERDMRYHGPPRPMRPPPPHFLRGPHPRDFPPCDYDPVSHELQVSRDREEHQNRLVIDYLLSTFDDHGLKREIILQMNNVERKQLYLLVVERKNYKDNLARMRDNMRKMGTVLSKPEEDKREKMENLLVQVKREIRDLVTTTMSKYKDPSQPSTSRTRRRSPSIERYESRSRKRSPSIGRYDRQNSPRRDSPRRHRETRNSVSPDRYRTEDSRKYRRSPERGRRYRKDSDRDLERDLERDRTPPRRSRERYNDRDRERLHRDDRDSPEDRRGFSQDDVPRKRHRSNSIIDVNTKSGVTDALEKIKMALQNQPAVQAALAVWSGKADSSKSTDYESKSPIEDRSNIRKERNEYEFREYADIEQPNNRDRPREQHDNYRW